jgi:hypothetical protein
VFVDATYLHVRRAGQVTSMAVVVATGVTAAGGREVLGLDVGDSEDEVFWRGFLRSLKQRGHYEVRLVISDQHAGGRSAKGVPGSGAPTLPGPLRSQPACPGPQKPQRTWPRQSSAPSSRDVDAPPFNRKGACPNSYTNS